MQSRTSPHRFFVTQYYSALLIRPLNLNAELCVDSHPGSTSCRPAPPLQSEKTSRRADRQRLLTLLRVAELGFPYPTFGSTFCFCLSAPRPVTNGASRQGHCVWPAHLSRFGPTVSLAQRGAPRLCASREVPAKQTTAKGERRPHRRRWRCFERKGEAGKREEEEWRTGGGRRPKHGRLVRGLLPILPLSQKLIL